MANLFSALLWTKFIDMVIELMMHGRFGKFYAVDTFGFGFKLQDMAIGKVVSSVQASLQHVELHNYSKR